MVIPTGRCRGEIGKRCRWFVVIALATLSVCLAIPALGQDSDDCMMCHEDEDLTGMRADKEISVYVDPAVLGASVHDGFDCIDCHTDLAGADFPHEDELARVACAECHDDAAAEHARGVHRRAAGCTACHGEHDVRSPADPASLANPGNTGVLCGRCHGAVTRRQARSLHGRSAARGDELAPTCLTCHGHHEVLSHLDPRAPTSPLNIPGLCGQCHHEGTEVSLQRDIPQERILENYSQSIHGEGLFLAGLTVTAVCTSCHTSHEILEPTDPRSSIHRDRVAQTCMACHGRIEQVHVKVIEGRLWEEEPHKIPSCSECHSPHKIQRRSPLPQGAGTEDCLECHSNPSLTMERDGKSISLYVDASAYNLSKHSGTACAQCHTEVTPSLERACASIISPVDCSTCHAERVREHSLGMHGILAAEGDPNAPTCFDCHEKHATSDHLLPTSPTFKRNIPQLCARCHRQGEVAALRIESDIPDIVGSYAMSIHGKGLVDSGLVVSATCTDCHTAHMVLPADRPDSSVNPDHIADTCGACHYGVEETFKTSVHWPANTDTDRSLPTCEDCHTSHTISRTDAEGFRFAMMAQCGRCHVEQSATFFDTVHGKVSRLGSVGAAKCSDCHGRHDILRTTDPGSSLSRDRVVQTCGQAQCHPGAHRRFAGYLTHATHHDPDKYPYLFYSFWAMTVLLVGTMTFALLHTFAWLWRLWRTREHWLPHKGAGKDRLFRRFNRVQRTTHLIMLLSFFTLALTGMVLKFSYMRWAQILAAPLGGFATTGVLHRVGAVALLILFAFHLVQVWLAKRESGRGWLSFIFRSPNTMMFTLTDLEQVGQSIKWFFGRGQRPPYGRFTYWEKFDYFAVFWGVFVIGSTGLVLWFPELFTYLLPGWSVNVATIIHSDEALLAVAFIFTVHFFNTHFRPDKFPMDTVIFTGRVPLRELAHDKPAEYQYLETSGRLEELEKEPVRPFPAAWERAARVFGFCALGVGLTLVALIVYSMLIGYR